MTAIRKATLQITYFQYITVLTTDYSSSNDRFGLMCNYQNSSTMVNVRLAAMGNNVDELDMFRIIHWKSKIFTVDKELKRGVLPQKADNAWEYSLHRLNRYLPNYAPINNGQLELTFFVINAPIEGNSFTYILDDNRVVITYYQAKELLLQENIPLENYLIF